MWGLGAYILYFSGEESDEADDMVAKRGVIRSRLASGEGKRSKIWANRRLKKPSISTEMR